MAPQMQNIGLKQVSRLIPHYEGLRLGEDFFLVDVDSGQNLEFMNDPFRADAYFLVYCVNGGLDIEVNLKSYSLSSDMLLISLPGSILRVVTPLNKDSRDGRFLVLAFSKDFLTDINIDIRKATDGHYFFSETPCIEIDREERRFLSKYLSLMKDIMDTDIPGKKGALGALFSSIFYVLSGLYQAKMESNDQPEVVSSSQIRLKLLFESFMKLVSEYHISERGVAFYAGRLGLTPKYLSKLVKQYSGRSAPDWIDSFVILEAKSMLRYSGDSIKEIVYRLNFLNPSVFYKYFKAHTGMTPSEYRNGGFA